MDFYARNFVRINSTKHHFPGMRFRRTESIDVIVGHRKQHLVCRLRVERVEVVESLSQVVERVDDITNSAALQL